MKEMEAEDGKFGKNLTNLNENSREDEKLGEKSNEPKMKEFRRKDEKALEKAQET